MTAITVDHVTKVYHLYDSPTARMKEALHPFRKKYHHDFYALNDVSFSVEQGEVLGIIGKNGCGKSTLLKILAGVLTPTSGTVSVNGNVSALLELGSGFNPEFTGLENVYFSSAIMGYSREQVEKNLDNILAFADIGEFIHQPVKTYSSGMYVRLAFAVAINVEPDILIVDEALSVGDVAFQTKCISKMQKIMKNGCTVLFVSHDTGSLKRFCHKCVYLKKGGMQSLGESGLITDEYLSDIRAELVDKRCQISTNASFLLNKASADTPVDSLTFLDDLSFDERVKLFRQGTGAVRVCGVEILDNEGNVIIVADFNQEIRLRIHIKFFAKCSAGINYHIRDSKNIEILGSGTVREEKGLIDGNSGDCYTIEFITRLPLIEDTYNLLIIIFSPIILNRTSLYHDWVENAYIFKVNEDVHSKLWNKVYIENNCRIFKQSEIIEQNY